MLSYKDYFRNKKITVMGLGLLGRGVNVVKFLAECGAELTVTDLKTREQLAPSLKKLEKFQNIYYVLGEHRLEDFRDRDMIIKAAGVPIDSPYIAEAERQGIPIKMDASLFMELCPEGVMVVGITGTRGKSTTTHLIYEILNEAPRLRSGHPKRQAFLGGNVKGTATLPLLKKVKSGDIVVLELDSWQLQGFGDAEMSPNVAVFTTFFDDHLNYYKGDRKRYLADKANIFKFQNTETQGDDAFILGEQAAPSIRKHYADHAKRATIVRSGDLPKAWKLKIPGEHNRYNASLALAAAHALGVPKAVSKKVIEGFKGIPGRLEYVRTACGIKIYNDTCATTPDATIAALTALGAKQNVVLIMGGFDKNLDMNALVKEIPKHCKAVVLLAGSGSDRIEPNLQSTIKNLQFSKVTNLRDAVKVGLNFAKKGDTLVLSPAFASFGMFKNEYDRGEQFMKIVRRLR
jgi:UDP-N-acetylmuramoylalanine--D-glutamate ligase